MARAKIDIDAWTLHGPSTRDLDRREVEVVLRDLLDPHRGVLSPADGAPGHDAGKMVLAVDSEAWIRWSLTGLGLFSRSLPTLREARDAAARVLLGVVLARSEGNLSATSRALGLSRKVLRDTLRRLGMYPLCDTGAASWDLLADTMEPTSGSEILRDARAALKAISTVAPFATASDATILSEATEALTRVLLAAVLAERG